MEILEFREQFRPAYWVSIRIELHAHESVVFHLVNPPLLSETA